MIEVGLNLDINPELLPDLDAGQKLWHAAHGDGSDNRINPDTVLEASTYSAYAGALAALFMGIRKKFRNRGKTKADLAAEKEAAKINRTCGALEELLSEYIRSAREGQVDEETLGELTDALGEMKAYEQAGKLAVPGKAELAEIRKSIAGWTAAMAQGRPGRPAEPAAAGETNEFGLLREQLVWQRELLCDPE